MSGGRTTMTHSHSVHGGALSFMSCTSGRESSPLDENDSHQTGEFKTETKKKRFHPLRNLRRMFRRKSRHSNVSNDSYNIGSSESTEIGTPPLEQRSCSTSKLVEENAIQSLIKNNRLAPGLSLSHDSVFTPDRADSGLSSSDLENSSLSISNVIPPPMEYPLKSHSSCSESSLLSMDSSEAELGPSAIKYDLDLGVTSCKLSHSAAKHKMAVKPKRNHGAPRSRRRAMNSKSPLPATPEVNEETVIGKNFPLNSTEPIAVVEAITSITSKPSSPTVETVYEKMTISNEYCSKLVPRIIDEDVLPPKIAVNKLTMENKTDESLSYDNVNNVKDAYIGEGEVGDSSISKKNIEETRYYKDGDWCDKDEGESEVGIRKEESFFGRLLSRRSDKKKKNKQENHVIAGNEEKPREETLTPVEVKSLSPVRGQDPQKNPTPVRSVNRRQRVEPIEIPSSPSVLRKIDGDPLERNFRDSHNRMKTSYSMSPPKLVLPNVLVSRSSSPPKVVWPEHYSHYKSKDLTNENTRTVIKCKESNVFGEIGSKKDGEYRKSIVDDSSTKIQRDLSPVALTAKETQKIIADEMETKFKMLHSLNEDRRPKNCSRSNIYKFESSNVISVEESEKSGETDNVKLNKKRLQEEDVSKFASPAVYPETERVQEHCKKEDMKHRSGKTSITTNPNERLELNVNDGSVTLKQSLPNTFSSTDVLITHEEPHYVNLKNILPVLSSYEKVHHGYENVQVIELVKKENYSKRNQNEGRSDDQKSNELSTTSKETEIENEGVISTESSSERRIPKLLNFYKSKSGILDSIDGTPEFMKVQLNRVEPRDNKLDDKIENIIDTSELTSAVSPKSRSTLVERRKSELLLSTETEDKYWKPKVKTAKKQTSFTEGECVCINTAADGALGKASSNGTCVHDSTLNEKTEVYDEISDVVVLRKKSNTSGNGGDEQPELMKVFARRSLKVRESEDIMEEMRRSRDSDKENENSESPKEERKKFGKTDTDENKQKEGEKTVAIEKGKINPDVIGVHVSPLKPEILSRKSVFQKLGKIENGTVETKTVEQERAGGSVSVAENRVKTRQEHSILEENKMNKRKEIKTGNDLVTVSCIKEAVTVSEEDSEETGFKRIQQRKAEWERRVQQAAK